MKILKIVAWVLLIVGGLNWGLVGVADTNVVEMLFGGTGIDRLIYILVGLSAIYGCFCCCTKGCSTSECK